MRRSEAECINSFVFALQVNYFEFGRTGNKQARHIQGADGSHFVSSGSVNTQMKESYFHFSCTSEWELTEEEVQSPTGISDAV